MDKNIVEYQGKLYTVPQFAAIVGQSLPTVRGKLSRNVSPEDILAQSKSPSKNLTLRGVAITVPRLAKICGCVPVPVYQRLKSGMDGDAIYDEFKIKNNLPDLKFVNFETGEKMKTENLCLVGFAIGDALGRFAETGETLDETLVAWAENPIYRTSAYEGLGASGSVEGAFTDDTQMTLCLATACKQSMDRNDFSRRMTSAGSPMAVSEIALGLYGQWFQNWPNGKNVPGVIDGPRGIGSTVQLALTRYTSGERWQGGVVLEQANSYVGNGALMRCLPLAIFYRNDLSALMDAVRYDTCNTHNSPEALAASYAYCHIIVSLLKNQVPGCIARAIESLEESELEYTVVYESLRHVRTLMNCRTAIPTTTVLAKAVQEIGNTGYVAETLAAALFLGLKSENASDMLVGSILAGGDTDTRTALAGAIAAIRFGIETFPAMWLDGVESKNEITTLNQWLLDNPSVT